VRRRLLIAVGALLVFGVGVAVGEAIHDNPQPGGMQTLVRTLRPVPLAPAALETVTVTTAEGH
jgi:hypothetical protein